MEDSLQGYNSSTTVDRARDQYSVAEAGLVARRKERKEGVHTLVQKEDKHFSSQFLICFNSDASEAEVVTDIKKPRRMNYQIP